MIITEDKAHHLDRLLDYYLQQDAFFFDVETRPGPGVQWTTNDEYKEAALDRRTNEIYWVSLATYGRADCIPLGHPNGEQIGWQPAPLRPGTKKTTRRVPKYSAPPPQLTPGEFFSIVKPLFFDTDIIKSAFNLKFDAESIAKYYGEAPVPPYQDVIVAKSLLNENPPHGLEYCVPAEFNFRYDKVGKILHTLPFSAAADYSHLDSKYGWLLRRSYLRRLAKEGLLEYFLMECDVTEVLVNTEMVGAPVRLDEVDELDGYLREEMDQIAGDLFAEAGEEFSLTAGADKAWFIYEVREHEPTMFTEKKHEPSTAAAALEQYTHDPMVAKLMRWNDLHKLHSTYVVNLQKYAALDGRIHADFKQHGTRTGRFSCGEPNLQNIPKPDTPEGKRIRGLFWAGSDDECLVVGDYSQIELRVLAHYTGDPTMMQAFFDGEDIHQASADTLGCDRGIAKNINFAIPFGAGYRKVAAMGGGKFGIATAKKFYNKHKEDFPRVWAWIEKTKYNVRAKKPHEVYTLLGRKRRLPNVALPRGRSERLDGMIAQAERQAVNTKIQGSAADIIKRAMVRLHDTLDEDMHIILQIHDELVVTTPRAKAEKCLEIMREAMEGDEMQMLRVPVTANIKIVDRWSDAK